MLAFKAYFFFIFVHCLILQQLISSTNATTTTTKTRHLSFESEPQSVYTELNKTVHLKCIAEPKRSRIQWLINEEPVRIDANAIFTTPDSLIIRLPERTDQNVGLYSFDELVKSEIQCKAEYKNQALLSQPAKITVAYLDDFPLSEDEIKVDVKERQIAVIPCKPPNSPPTVETNFIFKNKLIESNDNKKYYLMPSGDLQIFNVTMEDSGQYRCIAHNPYLKEKKNSSNLVTLHVEKQFQNLDSSFEQDRSVTDKIKFLTTPKQKYSVIRGTNQIIFECVASSILPVNISWFRDDRRPLQKDRFQIMGGNLVINNIQASDQGIYNCEATNGHKTITATSELVVKQTPSIKTELDQMRKLQLGEQTEFECSVNGNPIPRIDWYLNGVKLTNLNSAQYDIELTTLSEDTSKLVIKKVSEFHNGIIQCFASNDVSTVYSSGRLEITSSIQDNGGNDSTNASFNKSTRKRKKNKNRNKSSSSTSDLAIPKPKIIRVTSDSVIVHWKTPKQNRLPITSFKIQYKDLNQFNSTTDWITIDDDIPPNINSFLITSLQSDRFYKFRIMAVYNHDSQDGRISDKFFLAKNPIIARPTTIPTIYESKSDSSSTIEIYWDCRFGLDEKVDGFIIHYRPMQSAEIYHKITIDNNRTRAHTITHLHQSKHYDIRIQSFNSGGVSDFSKITTVKTQPALAPESEDDELIDETPDNLNPSIDNSSSKEDDQQSPSQPAIPSHNNQENNNKDENNEHHHHIVNNKTNNNDQSSPSNESNEDNENRRGGHQTDDSINKHNNKVAIPTDIENNSIESNDQMMNNRTTEQNNLKQKVVDSFSTQSPLFYLIMSIVVLINLIILLYCYIIVKRLMNRNKKSNKHKNDDKFDLDDENFILKAEEDSFNRSFTKMNVFNEPIYSTNPHLTRKAIKSYNHNYATIGGRERNMFNNKSDVYDSSLMNVRVNKFCDDSITSSMLAINKSSNSNQISKRDLPNHQNRISSTISHHNLTRPTTNNHHHHHLSNNHSAGATAYYNHSNIHNKNPLLPETNLKAITNTLGRHNRPTTRNFEDLYGTTGIHFATINRSNSVARLNGGTLERTKRKSSRNDLFSVLNIKEENEQQQQQQQQLGPTQIVDLQGSPNYRAVRFSKDIATTTTVNNTNNLNFNAGGGGLTSSSILNNGNLHNNMSIMSNGLMNSTLNVVDSSHITNSTLLQQNAIAGSSVILNNHQLLPNLTNNDNNINNSSLNSSNLSSNLIMNSGNMSNYENHSPYLTTTTPTTIQQQQQSNQFQATLNQPQQQQQQQHLEPTFGIPNGMMQSSC